jgi:hypothetical protein
VTLKTGGMGCLTIGLRNKAVPGEASPQTDEFKALCCSAHRVL